MDSKKEMDCGNDGFWQSLIVVGHLQKKPIQHFN